MRSIYRILGHTIHDIAYVFCDAMWRFDSLNWLYWYFFRLTEVSKYFQRRAGAAGPWIQP